MLFFFLGIIILKAKLELKSIGSEFYSIFKCFCVANYMLYSEAEVGVGLYHLL